MWITVDEAMERAKVKPDDATGWTNAEIEKRIADAQVIIQSALDYTLDETNLPETVKNWCAMVTVGLMIQDEQASSGAESKEGEKSLIDIVMDEIDKVNKGAIRLVWSDGSVWRAGGVKVITRSDLETTDMDDELEGLF